MQFYWSAVKSTQWQIVPGRFWLEEQSGEIVAQTVCLAKRKKDEYHVLYKMCFAGLGFDSVLATQV